MLVEHSNRRSVSDSMKIKSDTYLEVKAVDDAGLWFCVSCCRHTGAVNVYRGTEIYFSATVLTTKGALYTLGTPRNVRRDLNFSRRSVMLMEFTDTGHYLNS